MAGKEIRFKNPPLNEIVFQVTYPEIKGFGQAHIGLFWAEIRDTFPTIQSAPRLGLPSTFNLRSGILPDNRLWLVHKDNSQVIQIQDDRLLFNWRETGDADSYPGFDVLYPVFKSYYARLMEFLEAENLNPPTLTGFELNYINHIFQGVWTEWREISKVFPAFNWAEIAKKMPPLQGFRHFVKCQLPNSLGELAIAIDSRTLQQSGKPLIQFEIKVTASGKEIGLDSLDDRFLPAHDTLVDTLTSMTSREIQKSWNKL